MSTPKYLAYLAIGLFFMFVFGRICPTWGPVTRVGVQGISIFAATLFMISTGFGLIVPSMLAMFAITLTGYTSVAGIIGSTFGSTSLYQLFLVYVLCTAITTSGAGDVFARWMLSRKFINGRPVLFCVIFMLTMSLFAALVGTSGAVLFSFTLIDSLCDTLGYDPHSHFKKTFLTGAFIAASIGSPILPFKGMGLLIFGNVASALQAGGLTIDYGAYIASALICAVLFAVVFALLIKPLFRADLSLLRDADMVKIIGGGSVKMNFQQAFCFWGFVVGCCYSIALIFIPKTASYYNAFNSITQAFTFALVICVLSLIRRDQKPLLNPAKMFKEGIKWEIIYAYCAFSTLGGLLAADTGVGIKDWLTSILDPLLGGMPFVVFALILVAVTTIITNFFSNTATGIIVGSLAAPYLISYATGTGINPNVLGTAIVSAANCAYLTMGAGNMSAVYLAQDCLKNDPKWVWKWGVVSGVIYIIVSWAGYTMLSYIL